MDYTVIVILAGAILLYGLVSNRLDETSVTAPMVLTGFGVVVAIVVPNPFGTEAGNEFVELLAEVTLILVLFSDAARIDLRQLKRDHNLPQRMLVVGMPLSIVLGAIIALVVFNQITFWEAALLAAVLAPTDAALGQAVVSSPLVPVRIRQALNVESGLNDGIALPFVMILTCLASAEHDPGAAGYWLKFGLLQVTMGPLAGLVVAYVGAKAIGLAIEKNWITEPFQGLAALSIAFLAFGCAELMHGNGFIAAFVAGLVFGNKLTQPCKFLYEFAETEGQLLTLLTFSIFGAVMMPMLGDEFQWTFVLYALISLTLVRMVPVALSLAGSGVRFPTVSFLGWFGPRGLASILFALLIIRQAKVENQELILLITITTVSLSILLHGVSAGPASKWYGAIASRMSDSEEQKMVGEMPYRVRTSITRN